MCTGLVLGRFHADQVGRRVGLVRVDGEGRVGADYAGGLLNHLGDHRRGRQPGAAARLRLNAGEHVRRCGRPARARSRYADSSDADDVNEVPAVLVAREVS